MYRVKCKLIAIYKAVFADGDKIFIGVSYEANKRSVVMKDRAGKQADIYNKQVGKSVRQYDLFFVGDYFADTEAYDGFVKLEVEEDILALLR